MKRLTTILCSSCIAASAMAQSGVRIGNLEIYIKKSTHDQDTIVQVTVAAPGSSKSETAPKPEKNPYRRNYQTLGFCGIGFILPDNSGKYYTALGGSSINIDIGTMHRYQISRRFALGGTFQYSYYNYRLRNAANDRAFMEEVTGRSFDGRNIRKQVYRSHNLAAGAFTRFYLIAPLRSDNHDGLYIDAGVQGDFAFSKYYKIKHSEGKNKYRNGYAFNPFTASAVARIGWKWNCRHAIYVRYRFTDAFNSKALPLDLPPITIGVQLF